VTNSRCRCIVQKVKE